MNAENIEPGRAWVFYDGECSLCRRWVEKWRPLLTKENFGFATLQTPWVCERVGLKPSEPLTEMKVLTRDKRVLGGIRGVLYAAQFIWWMKPLVYLSKIPGVMPLLDRVYRAIAQRRHCLNGRCELS